MVTNVNDLAESVKKKQITESAYKSFFNTTDFGRMLIESGLTYESIPAETWQNIANTYGISVEEIQQDFLKAQELNYASEYGKDNFNKQMSMNKNIGMLMDAFNKYQPDTMNVDPTTGLSNQYQTYLDALNAASNQQYNIAMQELDVAENQMLRSIGLSQRQMERDIAKRRQQALKSGMSTAQLAAQEQQNILAAQTGATQIAQQYADQRYGTINQFAGSAAQNYANVLGQQTESLVNAQNNSYNNLMSAWAQMYAADKYQQ